MCRASTRRFRTPERRRPYVASLDDGRLTGVSVLAGHPQAAGRSADHGADSWIGYGYRVCGRPRSRAKCAGWSGLSAIPLHAAVIAEAPPMAAGPKLSGSMSALDAATPSAACAGARRRRPMRRSSSLWTSAPSIDRGFSPNRHSRHLLRPAIARSCCSLIRKPEAMADARKLQLALAMMTLLGLLLVAFGSWKAARRITEPLAPRLDEAAAG